MTASIRRRIVNWPDPWPWSVRCCTVYADSEYVPESGNPGLRTFSTEDEAVRSLAAHLADEHGVMVIRELTVTDCTPCDNCPTGTAFGGFGCPKCNHTGEIRRDRTVTVNQHTVEARP